MKLFRIIGLGLAVLTSTLGEASTQSLPEWNVILISWDGVQRAHLWELREQKALPNLEALAAAGAALPMEIRGHATDTKAGHAEMLSGYGPQITGVFSNRRYQAIPDGLTIFERLKARFDQQIATIAITGKRQNIIEILENALPEIDFALIRTINAARSGPIMLRALMALKDRAFFAFFHFSDPDHAGHAFGENSQEYSEAIKTCDLWLGRIVATLQELGILSKTLIYVTTDHGFDEGRKTHSNAPDIWLVTNDPTVAPPEDGIALQGDLVPTLLERFGFELGALEPPLPGRSLIKKAIAAGR
ncbi:MAG: alkaline phosphatase family protein [Candidatus Bipolaricaulota bacterium]|nr:alkaline phosphatase family protein [Candidatus Bipolaricaulota bacterium]MDW8031123.1 alkaline phosphatase family protein [Candidatus Bipolaricaulota bacterium]